MQNCEYGNSVDAPFEKSVFPWYPKGPTCQGRLAIAVAACPRCGQNLYAIRPAATVIATSRSVVKIGETPIEDFFVSMRIAALQTNIT